MFRVRLLRLRLEIIVSSRYDEGGSVRLPNNPEFSSGF
jgi:hypothetical protein